MKRLVAVAVGIMLSASLIISANAAPKKKSSAVVLKQPQGIINSKKVMQYRIEREKKMIEVRKKAQAQKHQARAGSY